MPQEIVLASPSLSRGNKAGGPLLGDEFP